MNTELYVAERAERERERDLIWRCFKGKFKILSQN
jgi:hypothetical protein